LIVDNELAITVELKDYTNESTNQAIGLTTHSNSEATILSYASIFETLWTQAELNEQAVVEKRND
jgi:two-component system sensor histidine kinase VicK